MTDIRELLQKCGTLNRELDEAIAEALDDCDPGAPIFEYSTDYNEAISYIENKGCDWIMANVNGDFGGTPFACVGVPEDKASYSATPLLSLWLSFFRLQLGDEREEQQQL